MWNINDVEIRGTKRVNVANCVTEFHLIRMPYLTPNGSHEDRLDMTMTHRSADLPVGATFDWAGWALLQRMIARYLEIPPGSLTGFIEVGQIYEMQIDKVKELLKRPSLKSGEVKITGNQGSIYDYKTSDFELVGYDGSNGWLPIPTAI